MQREQSFFLSLFFVFLFCYFTVLLRDLEREERGVKERSEERCGEMEWEGS
jgi:hypothetical protein